MPITAILFLFIIFCGLLSSIWYKPIWGVLTYIGIYMTLSKSTWWNNLLMERGIRLSLIAFVILVISVLSHQNKVTSILKAPHRLWISFLLFLFTAFLSFFTAPSIEASSWEIISKLTKCLFFTFIMIKAVTNLDDYKKIRWLWVFAGLFLGYRAYNAGYGMFSQGRLTGIGGSDFEGSSGFGAHMAMTLPLIGIGVLTSTKKIPALFAIIAGAFTTWALILSQTRSAFIAIFLGTVYSFLICPSVLRKKLIKYTVLATFSIGIIAGPQIYHRMQTIKNAAQEESAGSRLKIWAASIEMVKDHPFGVGIGQFQNYIGLYIDELAGFAAHNTYIRCIADLGILGLSAYLFIIYTTFKTLSKISNQKNISSGQVADISFEAYALKISLFIALTAGFFTERLYTEGYWLLFGMAACLEKISLSETEKTTFVPNTSDNKS